VTSWVLEPLKLDFMVALGTHTLCKERYPEALTERRRQNRVSGIEVFNHEWAGKRASLKSEPSPKKKLNTSQEGRLKGKVPIVINEKDFWL